MARVMEVPISEDDWQRFNRGETGVFVRKMLGFREKSKLSSIMEEYQNDGELREYAGRYFKEFEGMIDEARKLDNDGVLGTTFMSSDMGKLYMLLNRAVGREH